MNLLVMAGLICLIVGLVKLVGWLVAGAVILVFAVWLELS
jgi:hypothetical protein